MVDEGGGVTGLLLIVAFRQRAGTVPSLGAVRDFCDLYIAQPVAALLLRFICNRCVGQGSRLHACFLLV